MTNSTIKERMVAPHFFIAYLEPFKEIRESGLEINDASMSDVRVGVIEVAPKIRGPVANVPLDPMGIGTQWTTHDIANLFSNRPLIDNPDLPVGTKILLKASDERGAYLQPIEEYQFTESGRFICSMAGVIAVIEDDDDVAST